MRTPEPEIGFAPVDLFMAALYACFVGCVIWQAQQPGPHPEQQLQAAKVGVVAPASQATTTPAAPITYVVPTTPSASSTQNRLTTPSP